MRNDGAVDARMKYFLVNCLVGVRRWFLAGKLHLETVVDDGDDLFARKIFKATRGNSQKYSRRHAVKHRQHLNKQSFFDLAHATLGRATGRGENLCGQ